MVLHPGIGIAEQALWSAGEGTALDRCYGHMRFLCNDNGGLPRL